MQNVAVADCHRKLKRSDITKSCCGVCDQFYHYKCADVTESWKFGLPLTHIAADQTLCGSVLFVLRLKITLILGNLHSLYRMR